MNWEKTRFYEIDGSKFNNVRNLYNMLATALHLEGIQIMSDKNYNFDGDTMTGMKATGRAYLISAWGSPVVELLIFLKSNAVAQNKDFVDCSFERAIVQSNGVEPSRLENAVKKLVDYTNKCQLELISKE